MNTTTSGLHQALEITTLESGFESATGEEFTAEILERGDYAMLAEREVNKDPLQPTASFHALTHTYYDGYDWTNTAYSPANNAKLIAGDNPYANGGTDRAFGMELNYDWGFFSIYW